MIFYKMQATGNDFIIINTLIEKFRYTYKDLSKFLCNRKFGIGADGVIFLEEGSSANYKMRIFNSDGSEARNVWKWHKVLSKIFV